MIKKQALFQLVILLWFISLFTPGLILAAGERVQLSNESLELEFDLSTGSIKHWRLPGVLDKNHELHDLASPGQQLFMLEGQLGGKLLKVWQEKIGGWSVAELDEKSLVLVLEHSELPVKIKKSWYLDESTWRVHFEMSLEWQESYELSSKDSFSLLLGPGIGETPAQGLGIGQSIYSYTELVYSHADGVSTVRLWHDDEPTKFVSSEVDGWNWMGLQSRYFSLILSPSNEAANDFTWQASVPEGPRWYPEHSGFESLIRFNVPLLNEDGRDPQLFKWQIFGGGKAYKVLSEGRPDLKTLLFSGLWSWMRVLTLSIMYVLNFIQQFIVSWGMSIIVLAVLVRLIMHPVAQNAMAAQKRFAEIQQRIQPELQEIKKNYKGGEQSEFILQLYETHQVSPLAGLKPLLMVLIQLPIFIALYHLLGQAFDLRSASFLWMDSLAEPDQLFSFGYDLPFFGMYFNLLPVLMAFTTMLSIKLSPAPANNSKEAFRQNVMLLLMTLGFFLLFYSFPSGMVLYWTMANLLHFVHGLYVKRSSCSG